MGWALKGCRAGLQKLFRFCGEHPLPHESSSHRCFFLQLVNHQLSCHGETLVLGVALDLHELQMLIKFPSALLPKSLLTHGIFSGSNIFLNAGFQTTSGQFTLQGFLLGLVCTGTLLGDFVRVLATQEGLPAVCNQRGY
jgi:hypothetical protein